MGKTFEEWIGEHRKIVQLPSGIEAEMRRPSGLLMQEMGPLPGVDEVGARKQQVEISRRYVRACLVRLGELVDPIGSGRVTPEDFDFKDLDTMVDAVTELVRGKKKEAADGSPLAGTASPEPPPGPSTESPSGTE